VAQALSVPGALDLPPVWDGADVGSDGFRGLGGLHESRLRISRKVDVVENERVKAIGWQQVIAPEKRFWLKVWPRGDCWEWRGRRDRNGYGQVTGDSAHRRAFEMAKGPIPAGLTIDHLCRHPWCVKPSHLEAVSIGENVRRGQAPWAIVHRTNKCSYGHELTPENTYPRPDGSGKHCRICIKRRTGARERQSRICSRCGTDILSVIPNPPDSQRYCSQTCQRAQYNSKRREEYARGL
jgi:hypothetical protein